MCHTSELRAHTFSKELTNAKSKWRCDVAGPNCKRVVLGQYTGAVRWFKRSASPTKAGLTWTYTANSGCPGNGTLTLTIDRGNTFQTTDTNTTTLETTHILISYPYQWRFGGLIRFFAPSANYANGVTQISADAFMANLN